MRQPLYTARCIRAALARAALARAALSVGLLVAAGPLVLAGEADAGDAVERRLVFGSYADPANADADAAAVERALGIETERVSVEIEGETFVRLTSEAIEGEAIWPLSSRAAEARIDAWVWRPGTSP